MQAIAGHASAATTLRVYTHLRDARLEEAARRFGPAPLHAAEIVGMDEL